MLSSNYNDIQIEAYVNEAYAETYISQVYINTNVNPVEFSVELPNKIGVQFMDFEVEIKDTKVKSKLIAREKAQEKYSDAIAEGNTGIYSEYNKQYDKYIIHLGNIEPNTKVHFKSHFLQSLISNDLNYLFRLMDNFPFPSYNSIYYQQNNPNNYKIKIIFQTSSPLTIFEQKINGNNPIIRNRFNEDKTKFEIELFIKEEIQNHNQNNYGSLFCPLNNLNNQINNKKNSLMSFEFQIEDYKKPKLYKQYDPKNDETTYLLSYFKTINDEENNNNNFTRSFPGLYYFIIDQSGSMAGKPINLVIQTLKVFMQSLSKGSYYQLIGFGSDYKTYSDKPLSYTKENVNQTIIDIGNLKGNMGGTDLFRPLQYIYNNCKNNENLHLPQHIFILTDGYTENKEQVLNIIDKNKSKYQIYANGMGNDFDEDFIRTAGECGFGSYKFIKDIDNLSVVINEQLRKCMRYYYDKVKFHVNKYNSNEMIYDFYRNEFILENQLVNYSFIIKGKDKGNIEIKNSFDLDGNELNEIFKFEENKILNLKDGDTLAKITIHNLIQKGEGEDFSNEEKIIKIAKKYQILCEYTSLFAEVENKQENKEGNLHLIKIENNNYNNGGLFSNIYSQQNNSSIFDNYVGHGGSLFGNNSNYNNNTGGGLFGNNSNYNNNTGGGLFGNNSNYNNNTGGGLFGNNSNNTGKGLFGNSNNNREENYENRNIMSGFFGSINNNNNSPSVFNNKNNNTSQNLFVNNNANINNSPCLFGNNNNTNNNNIFQNNNNLFNNQKENEFLSFNNQDNNQQINNENKKSIENETLDINSPNLLEKIILSLDIIEGYWEENQFTNIIIDIKKNIYNQVLNIVQNNRIAVTFIILFYIINDKKEKILEYSNIINKAKMFLANSGYTYEFILSKI